MSCNRGISEFQEIRAQALLVERFVAVDEAVAADRLLDALAESHVSTEEKTDGGEEDDLALSVVGRAHSSLTSKVGIK